MLRVLVEKWLNTRGGRNLGDLRDDQDNQGYYVLMGDGRGGYMKFYLPNEEKMREDLSNHKY